VHAGSGLKQCSDCKPHARTGCQALQRVNCNCKLLQSTRMIAALQRVCIVAVLLIISRRAAADTCSIQTGVGAPGSWCGAGFCASDLGQAQVCVSAEPSQCPTGASLCCAVQHGDFACELEPAAANMVKVSCVRNTVSKHFQPLPQPACKQKRPTDCYTMSSATPRSARVQASW
jgi:hypothetical protein